MTYTFGLDTFGDRNSDADGTPLSHAQTIRNVVEEGVFAEQAGVDFFGIGEHHDAGVRHRVGGPPWLRAGDDQLGDQRDVFRVARRGDGHRVTGADGQPRDDRPGVARAEHRQPAEFPHQNPTTCRMRTMWMRPGSSWWISMILPT